MKCCSTWTTCSGPEDYLADRRTISAVERQLFILGEAAKGVPDVVRQRAPEIPWRHVCGLRDRLAHDYVNIDAPTIWNIATESVPELVASLVRLVAEEEAEARARR